MSAITITINSSATADRIASILNARTGLANENLNNLSALIDAINGQSAVDLTDGEIVVGELASGLVTFTGNPSNDETCTINGVVFTAKTSGATGNQFNIGASVTAHAANLAAAVNASTTAGIKDVISATSSLGVVTLTSKVAGESGIYGLSETLSNATVTAFALPSATTVRVSF